MKEIDIDDPRNYINRELSWLEFNERVLEEVYNKQNPLFERLRFLSIVSSNLDEFFMVRIAFLKRLVQSKIKKQDIAGLTPKQQLNAISKRVHEMIQDKYACWKMDLLPAMEKADLSFISKNNLNRNEFEYIDRYFNKYIYPVLTPLAVDSSRPFPLILNCSLNMAALIKNAAHEEESEFATVQIPSVLPRFIPLPQFHDEHKRKYIFLEDIIELFLYRLFNQKEIICSAPFRITRDSDLVYQEEEADNLLKEIEKSVRKRKWGQAIRLEVSQHMDTKLVQILKKSLKIHKGEIYTIDGPIDFSFLPTFIKRLRRPELEYQPYKEKIPEPFLEQDNIFKTIAKKDILLFHPYDSFQPVIDLMQEAANDPNVLAIKQTLYRVSGDSPIVASLAHAAERGKQVTVVVELKARFDEYQNINWARRLEESGCHVIYGLVGLKVHAKMTLIIRKEKNEIKRYLHLATGNYNDVTARIYSDIGLLTCDESLGSDASALFNMLSGYSTPPDLFKMEFAPVTLRQCFEQLIDNEIRNVTMGKDARIIAKMNSLVDKGIISKLYQASQKGVKIDLIVRGICCLIPGIPGLSENICVRSIVGRFLEHARIYYFYAGGRKKYFLSSADWMPRNLNKRVELLFPVEDKKACQQLGQILSINLSDNVKSRIMKSDGKYRYVRRAKNCSLLDTHSWLMSYWSKKKKETTQFIVKTSQEQNG